MSPENIDAEFIANQNAEEILEMDLESQDESEHGSTRELGSPAISGEEQQLSGAGSLSEVLGVEEAHHYIQKRNVNRSRSTALASRMYPRAPGRIRGHKSY